MQFFKNVKALISSPKMMVLYLILSVGIIASPELNRFQKKQRDKETKIALDSVSREQISLSRDVKNMKMRRSNLRN